MRWSITKEILTKELKGLYRDRVRFFFTVAFPVLLMVIFMLAYGGGGNWVYQVGVVDQDEPGPGQTDWGSFLVGNLTGTGLFDAKTYASNQSAQADLQQGRLDAVLVIPAGFSNSCDSLFASPPWAWTNATVQLYVDAGNAFTVQALEPLVRQALLRALFGESDDAISGPSLPVTLELSGLAAAGLDTASHMVSGMAIYSVFLLAMTSAHGVLADKERGTLKRYQLSQATAGDMLAGMTLGGLATAVLQLGLIVLVGVAMGFDPVGGATGMAGAVLASLTFALFPIGLGLIAGYLVRTEGAATGLTLTLIMTLSYFTGLFIPFEIMPEAMQSIGKLFPSYYANDAVKSLIARGAPITAPQVLIDFAVMGLIGAVVYVAGLLVYKRSFD
ncbi:MAG: ABC transporter permease [Promethearchaeota archaeon]